MRRTNDVSVLVGGGQSGSRRQQIVSGYVSLEKPAPAGFDDPAWVVIPSHDAESSIPLTWPADHGATLPAQGTPVVVGYDENGTPWLLRWVGAHS